MSQFIDYERGILHTWPRRSRTRKSLTWKQKKAATAFLLRRKRKARTSQTHLDLWNRRHARSYRKNKSYSYYSTEYKVNYG